MNAESIQISEVKEVATYSNSVYMECRCSMCNPCPLLWSTGGQECRELRKV
jgi:hypothetical protein